MRYAVWIVVLAACSSTKSSSPPPKDPPPVTPANCEPPPSRDAAAYEERRTTSFAALGTGRGFAWNADLASTDVAAAKATCDGAREDIRFLCFEGLTQGFGMALGKQHVAGTAIAKPLSEHGAILGRIDDRSNAIHCRGLGAGLNGGGLTTPDLAPLLKNVDPLCAAGLVDGFAARVVMKHMKLTVTSIPDAATLAALDLDTACPGLDAGWCGFAGGRVLGNLFVGNAATAMSGCHGKTRGACISGIAYVNTFLWDPDDLSRAVRVIETLPKDDKVAYIAGFASALQWLRRFDAAQQDRHIACLPAHDRELVQRIRATADACGAFDFNDGTNCKWSAVVP